MEEPIELKNKKTGVLLDKDNTGAYVPRLYHSKGDEKTTPHYLIKCGCCEEKFTIYYDDDTLEIAGVLAPIEVWKQILLPLLKIKLKGVVPRW